MNAWRDIATAPKDCEAILTIHEDDLYPVTAFCVVVNGEEHWLRETEGHEDDLDTLAGIKFTSLYRRPTHWMTLPETPQEERRPRCNDYTPSWYWAHWRDWHRGHGCHLDDGKPRRPHAQALIDSQGMVNR